MFSCSTERHWKTFLLPFFGMSRWNISSFSLLWGAQPGRDLSFYCAGVIRQI